jgi:hypothetical protein
MAKTDDKERELWIGWTRDAIGRYALPEDIGDTDELVDDMVDVATKYADAMLDEYDSRFSGGASTRKKRSRRKAEEEDDD